MGARDDISTHRLNLRRSMSIVPERPPTGTQAAIVHGSAMASPDHAHSHVAPLDPGRPKLGQMISLTFVLSVGISMAVAAMVLAAGAWLERIG